MSITDLGSISERRTFKMLDANHNEGLPAFLTRPEIAGFNSGFMIAQYTAAALVAENKAFSHPVSVDSIPTSANQEDHVSFAPIAARKAESIINNLENILAIELLCATQAADFRLPLRLGRGTQEAYAIVRKSVMRLDNDRILYTDIEKIRTLINEDDVKESVENIIGALK